MRTQRSKLLDAVKRMPELRHSIPGKEFKIQNSEVIKWLMDLGYLPSFCTACYRKGRTGDRFMEICKHQQIKNFCHPNAIMTLKAVSYTHLTLPTILLV